jgi:hypothetical protein
MATRRARTRSLAVALLLGGLPPVVLAVGAPPAFGANITVTSAGDAGPGTLRDAVTAAAAGDTITFSSALNGVPIQLTGPEILINKNVTIRGNGDDFTLIQRTAGTGRIFHNAAPANNVVIDAVRITGGNTDAGAGIQNESVVTMTLTGARLSGTTARPRVWASGTSGPPPSGTARSSTTPLRTQEGSATPPTR